jgi:hypothetical protein
MSPQIHRLWVSPQDAPFSCSSLDCDNDSRRRNCHHSPPSSKLPFISLESSRFTLVWWQDILHWLHASFHLFWHQQSQDLKNFKDQVVGCGLSVQSISDDKWIDVICTNYFAPSSKEKEEELKHGRKNMVRAVGSQWQHITKDFTLTN